MFVLFDAAPLQASPSRDRGIGRYTARLLAALRAARPRWDLRLLTHAHLPDPDAALVAGFRTHHFTPPLPTTDAAREANERYLADWITSLRPDRLLATSPFERDGLLPRFAPGPRPRLAAVVYDFIPLLFPHVYGVERPEHGWYAERLRWLTHADRLLAISDSTAADALRLLADDCPPVTNVRGAADPEHVPLPPADFAVADREVRGRLGLAGDLFLCVGGGDGRKNMAGAVAAFARLPADLRGRLLLVFACHLEPAAVEHVLGEARRHAVADRVRLTGWVADADLRVLYQGCRLLFFPSFAEGLGLPAAEALRYGTPVVAADIPSLREYAGPASWYCDPASAESMADALLAALAEPRDARAADRLAHAARFTWADTAARTAAAVEGLAEPASPRVPKKPRVAWVVPAPPSETGVADYALEVADVLADRFDLEWVADPYGPTPDAEVGRRYRVILADEFDARHAARPFDLAVYHVGNNGLHRYALPLLARHPGLVVLHDAHVGGLMRAGLESGQWPGSFADELRHNGEWLMADWVDRGLLHPHLTPTLTALNRRVLDLAAGVLVHSKPSWQKVRAVTDAPVTVVPHIATPPALADRDTERRRLGMPAGRFVVVTLGIVSATKRPDVLLRAVAGLPERLRANAHVLIVGPAGDKERDELRALAAELGLAAQVELRGKVPLADFAAYAFAADVCVQLRHPSNGETSGALARALAAGACCVTSDMPTMCDIPNTVTLKVRSPLRDTFDLTAALARLAADPAARDRMAAAARRYAAAVCGPAVVAAGYAAAIAATAARLSSRDGRWRTAVLNALADHPADPPPGLLADWARLRAEVLRVPQVAASPVRRSA